MKEQPITERHLDRKEFERIKTTVTGMIKGKNRNYDIVNKNYKPSDLGLFLTESCNLRCAHCFEWNEEGFLSNKEPSKCNELPFEYIKECIEFTKESKARIYLWGGEPLMYSKFSELCALLQMDTRWVTICTNGLLVKKNIQNLLPISDNLVLLTSIDGFEECHDSIRGKGTFKKTIDSIKTIVELGEKGVYKGKQSVNCVINDGMIGKLYDFCELMEKIKIDTLYICFPWYIPDSVANVMDKYYEEKIEPMLGTSKKKDKNQYSWHSFQYHIDPQYIKLLKEDLEHIIKRRWKIRIRFQPALEINEIDDFIRGGIRCAQKKSQCLAPINRLDVLANGSVTACKLFKEFTIGSLKEERIEQIWSGERFERIRNILLNELMPVCSKCVLLYLNGVENKCKL